MSIRNKLGLFAGTLGVALTVALPVPQALAGTPGLQWKAPATVTSGSPVAVASINKCPAVPTPGDTMLVQVTLDFTGGGGSGQLLTPAANGSWSGSVTFNFSGVTGSATLTASCQDFNGVTASPYANYRSKPVTLG